MSHRLPLCGAIEAGGTKFICAAGHGPSSIESIERIPTATPERTLARVLDFFRPFQRRLKALGVGSFGPIDVSPGSPSYGRLLETPKRGWSDVNVLQMLCQEVDVPVALETDVNAAALGEGRWGAGQSVDSFLYLTVGTGIGGGFVQGGRCLHGALHPEMGHIRVPREPDDAFSGCCPYHQDCLEGLASGPAIEARWGAKPEDLVTDHPAWDLQARYLASACTSFVYTLSPQLIILGGGVMQQSHLYPMIRRKLASLLCGYPCIAPVASNDLTQLVVAPQLGWRAGMLGAMAMAQDLLHDEVPDTWSVPKKANG